MCAAGVDHVRTASELVALIKEYRWIWDIKMTELVTRQYWTHVPDEWSSALLEADIQHLPDGYTQADWPDSLKSFITRCHCLKLKTTPPEWVCQGAVTIKDRLRLKPKKLHEVSRLTGVIDRVCDSSECDLVLDIGSGLGYLGRAVATHSARKVIGIERDDYRVKTAQHIKGHGQVTSIAMAVEWSPRLPSSISSLLGKERALLVGLHCCGDLTPTALRLFSSLPSLVAMIIVPCCYHKMAASSFQPLSCIIAELLTNADQLHVSSYGLRLAAQESAICWQTRSGEQSVDQYRHVLYRAILESVLAEDSLGLSANQVARAVRGISHINITVFIDQLLAALHSSLSVETQERLRTDLNHQHFLYQHHIKFIRILTALQACMQRPMESLILLDHLLYIKERSDVTAQLVTLFDEAVSPRCIAILAQNQI